MLNSSLVPGNARIRLNEPSRFAVGQRESSPTFRLGDLGILWRAGRRSRIPL
jgi:hypothetical protein